MRASSRRECLLCEREVGYNADYADGGDTVAHTACIAEHYKAQTAINGVKRAKHAK